MLVSQVVAPFPHHPGGVVQVSGLPLPVPVPVDGGGGDGDGGGGGDDAAVQLCLLQQLSRSSKNPLPSCR